MADFEETLDFSSTDSDPSNGRYDVHCGPPSGINVLIVGAGVGGLVAALECHRKGHNVRIWERSESAAAGGEHQWPPVLRLFSNANILQATCSPLASAADSSCNTTLP
jgi:cation diffusion facilitator CzcD-associated flavoprotein CzcO